MANDTGANGTPYGKTGENTAKVILGGPIGWYEAATGHSVLGENDPWSGTTMNPNMTEDVYNSMTPEEWAHFAHGSQQEQDDFIKSRQSELRDPNSPANQQKAAQAKADKEEAARQKAASDREAAQTELINKVKAFADEMNMPVDQLMQKDEFAQALNRVTYQDTMGSAMARGAGTGGLSQANADQATKNALLGYQFQRQQAGQQAYNQAYGMLANQSNTAEDIARYNQGMNLQMQGLQAQQQYQQYQQNLQRSGGMLGMIGAGVGAYFGGPAGMAAGYQIGSGVGQQNYLNQHPYTPYKYSYPSSGRPLGGLSSYGGGNY